MTKSVQFDLDLNQSHEIDWHTESDPSALYYCRDEYAKIREEIFGIVHNLNTGASEREAHAACCYAEDRSCCRGLEKMTHTGRRHVTNSRQRAFAAVLGEQARQNDIYRSWLRRVDVRAGRHACRDR